ncbi:MAG: class I adenylate-forming enzyme family protein [Pseudomonadota bacterium]
MQSFWPRLGSLTQAADGLCVSGAEINTISSRYARRLTAAAPCHGRNVVIAHGNSARFFVDLLAVWQAGGCAVCVNAGLTPSELGRIVDFVDAACILTVEGQEISSARPVLDLEKADQEADAHPADLDAAALILFTSGTTGDPKGVVHTHRSIQARIALNAQVIGAETLAKTLCTLPTHFGHGLIGNCLSALLTGGDVIIAGASGISLAQQLSTLIDAHDITFMSSVPALWKLALRLSAPPKGGSLRRVHIGSAPLSADLWRSVADWAGAAEVVNMYGITETANWLGGASSKTHTPQDGLLGTLWGGDAAVLTDNGAIAACGEGELLIRTPSLMQGYYQRPDLTDAAFHQGWYRTGDTGRIDGTGVLTLTGRNKSMINNAGIKIYPEELDLLFERHAQVAEACAFGVEDAVSGEAVALAVVPAGDAPDPSALRTWASEHIRAEALPRQIFVLDAIPKTDRGKINRETVRDHCLAQQKATS